MLINCLFDMVEPCRSQRTNRDNRFGDSDVGDIVMLVTL